MPYHRSMPGRLRSRLARGLRSAGALALLGAAACNLDLANPNAPTEEEIVSSFDGLIAVAVGLQDQYASTIDDYLIPNSLVTDEWATRSLALASYTTLLTGVEIDDSYATIYIPWANSYEAIRSANTILNAQVDAGPVFGPALSALAKTYRAMAFGQLATLYGTAAIDISVDAPVLRPRAEVIDTVIVLLEEARAEYAPLTATQLTEFQRRVIGTTFDLANVIDAMLARYYLFDGQYQNAIDAAERALAGFETLSFFTYTAPDVNPVYAISVASPYVGAAEQFATEAVAGDARVAFWADPTVALTANTSQDVIALARYQTQNASLPVFFPDEMRLIIAEALTRLGGATNLLEAADLVNHVHSDSVAEVDEPITNLDPLLPTALDTEAELLAQIEYERRYELYMQGLRWEDFRRFGEALTGEAATIEYLPIPQQECDANPSNPCGGG